MPLQSIEQLLKRYMGLHSATVGSSTVAQAVAQRMRCCKIDDMRDYAQVVQQSPTELNALVDEVVIPETWFFRDRSPFDALGHWLENEWLPRHALTPLRLLSIPCSSGEEAYTLAMCLSDHDALLPATCIDAVDISSHNIEKAIIASYGSNSFRGSDLAFRERFFDQVGTRYQLQDRIRERVNFVQANILDASFTLQRARYHVIFCRNLLIYFDRTTQEQVICRLEQLLEPAGLLFLGHSETSLLAQREFEPLPYHRCFGYRHLETTSRSEPVAPKKAPHRRYKPDKAVKRPEQSRATTAAGYSDPEVIQAPISGHALLKSAFMLADQGHLDEAAEHCQQLLEQPEHQADAYYLLGLVRQSAGNSSEAEALFRRAVYLEPAHHTALTHLAELCQQRGDHTCARRFRERANRAVQRINSGEDDT